MSFWRSKTRFVFVCAMLVCSGCFLPPATAPASAENQRAIIPLPYDLAWDAVTKVIDAHGLRVGAADQNHGIIEAEGGRFTNQAADCGKVKSVAGTYSAEPSQNSTSVYSFLVRPHGREETSVSVSGSYTSSVKVPFRTSYNVDCVSRGTDESRLLKEVLAQARRTHRPDNQAPPATPATETKAPEPANQSRRTTIDRPAD